MLGWGRRQLVRALNVEQHEAAGTGRRRQKQSFLRKTSAICCACIPQPPARQRFSSVSLMGIDTAQEQ